MRIIRLQAEGFKRLVAVDISPEGDLVELRGDNGNGKSSVLDAIYSALGGAEASPEKPVREGEEIAIVRLDLGELIVTRYFTAEGTTRLKVTTAEGAAFSNGQTILDNLVGHISFDPLEFLDLKPAEQAEELRKLVSIVDPETGEAVDLAAIATANDADFAKRRDVNRDARALAARIEAMGGLRHVPDDAPDREALVDRMAKAAETNSAIERERSRRFALEGEARDAREEVNVLRHKLAAAEEKLAQLDGFVALYADEPLEPLEDVDAIREQLAEADRVADNLRHNEQRAALMGEFEELKRESETLTKAMVDRTERRAIAIAKAEMPVPGLALELGEGGKLGVSFNGVPFSQASDAERLRVSAAVAMAANPELRVLRLKNASLLDKGAVATLRQLATDNDFQIWAEFVGDEGPGVIMEAGEVRGAAKPEPLERPRTRKKAEPADERNQDDSKPDPAIESKPATPTTLFERMGEAQSERPKPKAMTEFRTKPRS